MCRWLRPVFANPVTYTAGAEFSFEGRGLNNIANYCVLQKLYNHVLKSRDVTKWLKKQFMYKEMIKGVWIPDV